MSRDRAHVVAGIEPAFDGSAHDAEGFPVECSRARVILQVGKERLLRAMHAKRGRRNRDVLRGAGRTARLRVKDGSFGSQRRLARTTLAIDVVFERVVVLHRETGAVFVGRSDAAERVFGAELGALVRAKNSPEDALLCLLRRPRGPGGGRPVSQANGLHPRPEREGRHQWLNGARISAQKDFGYDGSCSPSVCTLPSRGRNQVPNTRSHTITVLP